VLELCLPHREYSEMLQNYTKPIGKQETVYSPVELYQGYLFTQIEQKQCM
jgi:hypothetical protein